jgi:hypothetical protein
VECHLKWYLAIVRGCPLGVVEERKSQKEPEVQKNHSGRKEHLEAADKGTSLFEKLIQERTCRRLET